ncbi:MAG: DUF4340 domain-containing protein [Pseudomonadota bacterium]
MIRTLALLLVVQLALVAVVYWPRESSGVTRTALLEISPEQILAVTIQSSTDESIELTRASATSDWQLASGLPADGTKMVSLMDALAGQNPGFPVATSTGAAERFEVDNGAFEKRLQFSDAAGNETTVFLGSSPSFRKVHARISGENEIFTLELNSFDAPTTSDQWLDQSLLATTAINSVQIDNVSFELTEDDWVRTDGGATDSDAASQLINGLGGLRVSGVAADDDDVGARAEPVVTLNLNSGDAPDTVESTLTVLKDEEEERYFLSSSRFSQRFDTSSYDAERLIEATEKLLGADSDEDALADDLIDASATESEPAPSD